MKIWPLLFFLLLPFLLLLESACSHPSGEISAQIETQFNASPTAPINLSLVGPSSWERVCVLGPYTMNEHVEKVLGFKWDATGKTSIGGNDGINVLVFIRDKEVVAYAEYPRNKGDFVKMKPRCLLRETATVIREIDSNRNNDGWVYLVTNQQSLINSSTNPSQQPTRHSKTKQ